MKFLFGLAHCMENHLISLFILYEEEAVIRCLTLTFFFSSRRRHTRFDCDWSSDVCFSDLVCRLLLEKKKRRSQSQSGRGRLPSAKMEVGEAAQESIYETRVCA